MYSNAPISGAAPYPFNAITVSWLWTGSASMKRGFLAGIKRRVSSENFKASESRLRNAVTTQDSAELTRLGILKQASVSVLAQATQQPALSLQLLS